MKLTQNDRINQVHEGTIVVGIDVASETHYARAFDWRGVELGKVISFSNRREGFLELFRWIQALQKKHGKSSVLLGAEPTGHYWFSLADYAEGSGIKLVLVNPHHVKKSKELDDNHPTKNDRKDAKTIAKLVVEGRYMEPYIPEGDFAELRVAMDSRYRILKEIGSQKSRMERWLKIYFPEYKDVFKSPYGKASLVVLRHCPLPEEVRALGPEKINELWRKEKLRAVGSKRARRLHKASEASIGRQEGTRAARLEMMNLLDDYAHKVAQLEEVEGLIRTLLYGIPQIEKVLAIKGMGLMSAAGIFAEIGDIGRFDSPKQIQKLAGLAIRENRSGKHQGGTGISRRGRKRLRTILFQVILPMVATNEAFAELHSYYTKRDKNPLKKKQSLIALCCKLIRIIFGICTKGFEFDGQKMLSDIKRPLEQAA